MAFVSGLWLGHRLQLFAGLLFIALVLSFVTATVANLRTPRLAWPAVLLVYLLLGTFAQTVAPQPDRQRSLRQFADNQPHAVEGIVSRLGAVRLSTSAGLFSHTLTEERGQRLDLRIVRINDEDLAPETAGLRLSVFAAADASFPSFACGELIVAHIAMHEEEHFGDPGVWDASEYLLSQGIGAVASAKATAISISGTGALDRGSMLRCRIGLLQQRASAAVLALADDARMARLPAWLRLSPQDTAMLTAMVTGDRTYLQHSLRVGFERTGTFHLLVVSGLHLAIFAGLIFALTKKLRLGRAGAALCTAFAATAYAVFTGFGHPVERSLGMVLVYLTADLLWRERRALNTLGLVTLLLLIAAPSDIFDAGMQMTLLTVIAVAGLARPLLELTLEPYRRALRNLGEVRIDASLPPHIAQFRVTLRLLQDHMRPIAGAFLAYKMLPHTLRLLLGAMELLLITLSIEVLMMLPMVAYFHRITVLGLPVNLLIVPLLGLLLPCALITFATALVQPSCAWLPGAATAALLHLAAAIVGFASRIHLAELRCPNPAAWAVIVWMALCLAAMILIRLRRRFTLTLTAAALIAAVVTLLLPHPMQRRAGVLEITAIDVGQGDALLVVSPEGKTLLIDAGGLVGTSPESNFDVGEDVVSPVLWARGIRQLDAVAITHAHLDHIGGMAAVIANFRPHALWIGKNPDSAAYGRVLQAAREAGTQTIAHVAGDAWSFGGAAVKALWPAANYHPGAAASNDDSLVLRVAYGETSALLEGDAEARTEAAMKAEGDLHSDLLKVGHHGSITSTTPAFLAAVAPQWAVISVGKRNFYGHPRREVLARLAAAHVGTRLTELTGMTSFYLDGKRVTAGNWP
ncbi:ComEC/Rec2 family competence protein [Silvibacterium sp.]|uniref:ComEC/Rec2 family competence protein n=1 Tax=Silvibacterium sp. TaxID=1964179 RepID=UPI0039E6546F